MNYRIEISIPIATDSPLTPYEQFDSMTTIGDQLSFGLQHERLKTVLDNLLDAWVNPKGLKANPDPEKAEKVLDCKVDRGLPIQLIAVKKTEEDPCRRANRVASKASPQRS